MQVQLLSFLIIVSSALLFAESCTNKGEEVTKISIEDQKIALGKKMFFDKRLSLDNTVSCGSCHLPEKAFADGRQFGVGIKHQLTTRNVPSILNSKFLKMVMFDASIPNLERQILVPLTEHNEMGSNIRDLMIELQAIEEYQSAAKKLYNRKFDAFVLTRSIAAYERSLVAMNSRYDKYMAGNKSALTKKELKGKAIFERLYCVKCHIPPHFTNFIAENNGLYDDYADVGRYRVSRDTNDIGRFKTPSLRNVGLTAPYMHDGSFNSLEEVVEHYMSGGHEHRNKSAIIKPFHLTGAEKQNLVLFLKSLSDKGLF